MYTTNLAARPRRPTEFQGTNSETWTYGYDNRNQLVQVQEWDKDPDDHTDEVLQLQADYEYDVFGNRIQKEVDDDGDSTVDLTQRYSYDGWKPGSGFVGNENWDIWMDSDSSNNWKTRYLRGDAIDQLFAWVGEGIVDTAYWTLTDRLGSVRDITDPSGVVKDTIVYDGFGNISSETDSSYRGRYAWTGRELDTETELQYNRARFYDASIGRWISQDPLGFEAGDSNLYRYANNNLVTWKDPSGLEVVGTNWAVRTQKEWLEGKDGPMAQAYGKGPGMTGLKMLKSKLGGRYILLAESQVEIDKAAKKVRKFDRKILDALNSNTKHIRLFEQAVKRDEAKIFDKNLSKWFKFYAPSTKLSNIEMDFINEYLKREKYRRLPRSFQGTTAKWSGHWEMDCGALLVVAGFAGDFEFNGTGHFGTWYKVKGKLRQVRNPREAAASVGWHNFRFVVRDQFAEVWPVDNRSVARVDLIGVGLTVRGIPLSINNPMGRFGGFTIRANFMGGGGFNATLLGGNFAMEAYDVKKERR